MPEGKKMLSTSSKAFILLIDNNIDAVTNSWDDMRDYCSETGKRGKVWLVNTKIPFGGNVDDVVTTKKLFGEIE